MNYGYNIKPIAREMARRGLTRHRLAKLAAVSPVTVTNVLDEKSGTPTTIAKLATALDIPMTTLAPAEPELTGGGEGEQR